MNKFSQFMESARRAAEKAALENPTRAFTHVDEPPWLKGTLARLGLTHCEMLAGFKDKDVVPPEFSEALVERILSSESPGFSSRGRTENGALFWFCGISKDRKAKLVVSDNEDAIFEASKAAGWKGKDYHRFGIRIAWLKQTMENRRLMTKIKEAGGFVMPMNKGGGFSEEQLKTACDELGIDYCV